MNLKKISLIFIIIIFALSFSYAKVEFDFSYGISRPSLGDYKYLYSGQNDELNNLKSQGFSAVKDFNFTSPENFKNFGGEIKFSISNSIWLGIEYSNISLNHTLRGDWEYSKTEDSITDKVSGNIEKFATNYKTNIIGLNLYWKFNISSFLEIEAGVGASYLMLTDENNYSAVLTENISYGSEYANTDTKITQSGEIKVNTFGGKAGLRLNIKLLKKAGIFAGAFYTYYSPKNLNGYFRYTASSTFSSSFDDSEYTNNITYNGDGDYHIIIKKGNGSDLTYIRPEVKPSPPGTETDNGAAKSDFSGIKVLVGVFFRF